MQNQLPFRKETNCDHVAQVTGDYGCRGLSFCYSLPGLLLQMLPSP
jgi:hypothetical protein